MPKFRVKANQIFSFYKLNVEIESPSADLEELKQQVLAKLSELDEKETLSADEIAWDEDSLEIEDLTPVSTDPPFEVWDSPEKFYEYKLKGYDASAEGKGEHELHYLYSKKGRIAKDFIDTFKDMPVSEWVEKYYTERKLRGLGQQEKTVNVMANFVLTQVIAYCKSLGITFEPTDLTSHFLPLCQNVAASRQEVAEKIVPMDKEEFAQLSAEYVKLNGSGKATVKVVNDFLRGKGLRPTEQVVSELRTIINKSV